MKTMKIYSFNGLTGCVVQRRAQKTGTIVGVYHGEQSGINCDTPETPWITVCEAHNNIVSHRSLSLAKSHAVDPAGWCEDCEDCTAGVQS